jgi:cysteine sulfinate desulfinase/cysteine desulfurase-like protein
MLFQCLGVDSGLHRSGQAAARSGNCDVEVDERRGAGLLCLHVGSHGIEQLGLILGNQGPKGGNVVISAVEHASISEPAAELARRGFKVTEIPVDDQGIVQLDALDVALNRETALVSIMAANNETGVLEPIPAIGQLIRERSPNALFHTDATQAIGKISVDLQTSARGTRRSRIGSP